MSTQKMFGIEVYLNGILKLKYLDHTNPNLFQF